MTIKYKMTPFARLLIFLLFFVPIVYIGMNVYKSDDPLTKLKSYIPESLQDAESGPISKDRFGVKVAGDNSTIELKKEEIKQLKARIKKLEREIDQLGN